MLEGFLFLCSLFVGVVDGSFFYYIGLLFRYLSYINAFLLLLLF